jgi:NAD(P)-dependent dehydrogenase (short-subunit alcohol dehydrogenase family)
MAHEVPGGAGVTIVTGAGSGIGRALARLLAERGHALLLAGRTQATLDETAALARASAPSARVTAVPCDVGDPARAAALVERARTEFGGLDTIVNCAGVARVVPLQRTDDATLAEALRTNTLGPAALIRAAWPHFVARRRGCIVNVSSVAAFDPLPGFFAYAASKAALDSMTRSCHVEGRAHGIRAFSVNPGAVETPMLRANFPPSVLPEANALDPLAVARVIAECIEGARDAERGRCIAVVRGQPVTARG